MKIIHLTNLKRECVLVELPDGAKNIRIGDWGNFVYDSPIAGEFAIDTLVPLAYRKFLGKFTDLKEDDFECIVHTDEIYDPVRFPWGEGIVYKNYNANTWGWSAKQSFISAIEGEGWHVNGNPIPPFHERLDDWKSVQEKVINLSNCYLFVKS